MSRRTVIGVDTSARWTAAAQVSVRQGRARIDAAACIPRGAGGAGRTPDARDMARVAEVLDRCGFRGRGVVAAAPDDRLIVANLELPPRSSGAPVDQLARVELGRMHKRDPESMEVAVWDVPRPASPGGAGSGATGAGQYMAAALDHADAASVLGAFAEPGLVVRAIDARAWAMARACEPLLPPALSAVMDLGESGTLLAVLDRGVVSFQRVLPDGGVERLRAGMTGPLGISSEFAEFLLAGGSPEATALPDGVAGLIDDHAEEIAREARPAIEYAAGRGAGGSVEVLLVMGAGARVPRLARKLGEALGLAARVVTPADVADCPAGLAEAVGDPRLTVAVGLARHGDAGAGRGRP